MGETSPGQYFAASSVFQGLSSFGTAYSQSQALEAQGDFQKHQYYLNQRIAEVQAKDAIKRGDAEASEYRKNAKGVLSSQAAGYAASGVDLSSETARLVRLQTKTIAAQDVIRIKNNAWREAWGYKVQATEYGSAANFSSLSTQNQSRSTLLSGFTNMFSYGLKGAGSFGFSGGNRSGGNNQSAGTPDLSAYG